MKKIGYIILLLSFFVISSISAKEIVTLQKCVDGDTAWFTLNGEKIKTRFLAIDTPESTNKIEPYGKEASDFTCNLLTNAKTIEIEYDDSSDKLDKYDRHLVWVFVDGKLLQDLIIKEGLADVAYLYGDYQYTDILKNSLKEAKNNKINMWSEQNNTNTYLIIATIVILIIAYIGSSSIRKKINRKVKSNIKRKINKKIDDIL